MGSIRKKTYTKPLAEGATVFTQEGQRPARAGPTSVGRSAPRR